MRLGEGAPVKVAPRTVGETTADVAIGTTTVRPAPITTAAASLMALLLFITVSLGVAPLSTGLMNRLWT
ncbi:MAG: hypothetical protein JWR85_2271 [Marmoricola sp.]|nr:hypothetical protein [Marmoricola sp.]